MSIYLVNEVNIHIFFVKVMYVLELHWQYRKPCYPYYKRNGHKRQYGNFQEIRNMCCHHG